MDMVVRDLARGDWHLVQQLLEQASPQTRYRRFLSSYIPPVEAIGLPQTVGSGGLALIAMAVDQGHEFPVALGQLTARAQSPSQAEISLLVADDWQGKGIGTLLVERLLAGARGQQIRCVVGVVFTRNRAATQLARKFGFRTTLLPQSAAYSELALSISSRAQ